MTIPAPATALPWHLVPWPKAESMIHANSPSGAVHVSGPMSNTDAAFARTACNSFPALVAALQAVQARGLPDRYASDAELAEQVNAALALALGEQ